jgi:hypothetical protein
MLTALLQSPKTLLVVPAELAFREADFDVALSAD